MPLDGAFLHHLTIELNDELTSFKINKIYQPSFNEIIFQLRGKNNLGAYVSKDLLLSCNLDKPKIYITTKKYINPEIPLNFTMLLRKYIDRGTILKFKQLRNDRVLEIHIEAANELGDSKVFILIFEIMGRNSNIILTTDSYKIIDAIRKFTPTDNSTRTIIPKATYEYPVSNSNLNPFEVTNLSDFNYHDLEGCSKNLQNELKELQITNVSEFLTKRIIPTYYEFDNKFDFYFLDLLILNPKKKIVFDSLSNLLEYSVNKHYEFENESSSNYQVANLQKKIKRIIQSKIKKIDALEQDYLVAKNNTKYNTLGILLQSSLYMVKPGMKEISINNFLENNDEVIIELDPNISASDNLKKFFKKGKKASTAIVKIKEQLEITKKEINYLDEILIQLSYAKSTDYDEIKQELMKNNYLKKKNDKKFLRSKKIHLSKIIVDEVEILIGKNNIQNEYLIHKVAKKNDLWFHVKNAPGAHVVVCVPNNSEDFIPSEKIIRTASNIASSLSKYSKSSSVAVDYTKIKYLKKIPEHQGYNVTYTNNKTIYIDPDIDNINSLKIL